MKFEVDEKLVEPIIRDQIAAAVVSQLGDTDELLQRMVKLALSRKVNSNGEVDKYSSYNNMDFVEAMAGKAIRDAAKAAVLEIIEKQKPLIQKAVEDHLKRSSKKTAAAIIGAFCESAGNSYSMNVKLEVHSK